MIRTQVLTARRERDTALLEAMAVAARGGGYVAESEILPSTLHTLMCHVIASPEFQDERPEVLENRLALSMDALVPAHDEVTFASLRRRLPDARNRLLAYGLAAKVAIANEELQDPDVQRLSGLQRGLEVSPAQARTMLSGLAQGCSPTEVVSEPPSRLGARLLELVLLSMGLDVSLSSAEVSALYESQEDPQQLRELGGQLLRRLAFGGYVEAPLEAIRRQLLELALVPSTSTPRRDALRLAVRFSEALGHGWPQELLLGFVQELFGLTDEAF